MHASTKILDREKKRSHVERGLVPCDLVGGDGRTQPSRCAGRPAAEDGPCRAPVDKPPWLLGGGAPSVGESWAAPDGGSEALHLQRQPCSRSYRAYAGGAHWQMWCTALNRAAAAGRWRSWRRARSEDLMVVRERWRDWRGGGKIKGN
jgi:hypothetical protein